ncbi:hypothetical protein ACTFIW_010317 [Dictyostelium discoideum]
MIQFVKIELSNLISDDSSSSSSSSSSHVSSSTGNIPRSIDQTISIVNTNPNSTTLETWNYSTFQSHVISIIRLIKSSTAELLMKSWEPSTLKVYSPNVESGVINLDNIGCNNSVIVQYLFKSLYNLIEYININIFKVIWYQMIIKIGNSNYENNTNGLGLLKTLKSWHQYTSYIT